MNADEMRKLSISKQLTTEDALKRIESEASCGRVECWFDNLKEETVHELMTLGFKLTIHKDNCGQSARIVSW